jgi:hypothetical protein
MVKQIESIFKGRRLIQLLERKNLEEEEKMVKQIESIFKGRRLIKKALADIRDVLK